MRRMRRTQRHKLIFVGIQLILMTLVHSFFLIIVISRVCVFFYQEKGITENYFFIGCHTSISSLWRLSHILCMAVLKATALVLAFKIRKIEIKVLNDFKEISAIVHITAVIDVGLIIMIFVLSQYNDITLFLFSGGLLIIATVIVGFVYIPKVFIHS